MGLIAAAAALVAAVQGATLVVLVRQVLRRRWGHAAMWGVVHYVGTFGGITWVTRYGGTPTGVAVSYGAGLAMTVLLGCWAGWFSDRKET